MRGEARQGDLVVVERGDDWSLTLTLMLVDCGLGLVWSVESALSLVVSGTVLIDLSPVAMGSRVWVSSTVAW